MQEKYSKIYHKVEDEMKTKGLIAERLTELCSAELDRNGNENQINVQLFLRTSLNAKTELMKCFDYHANNDGFVIDYVNVIGNLY